MRWQAVAGYPDQDLKAIFAHLRSLPPVRKRGPDAEVPPPVLQGFEQATPGC